MFWKDTDSSTTRERAVFMHLNSRTYKRIVDGSKGNRG